MTFGELKVGDKFRFFDRGLIWTKTELFTAYGYIKNHNAASRGLHGSWHYAHVVDATIVKLVEVVRPIVP